MKLAKLPSNRHSQEFVQFGGGLDVVTPPVLIPPGMAREATNFEEDINGGYKTLSGYERFDGRPAPSSAKVTTVGTVAMTTPPAVGSTITGAISGATAIVVGVLEEGLVLVNVIGVFVAESVGVVNITGALSPFSGSANELLNFLRIGQEAMRAMITAVPGIGNVLGVWYYNGLVYAFRNNAGVGASMYKSSATGWQAVPLGISVGFSGGSGTPPAEGDPIAQGFVSGNLKRLVIETGTFLAGNAAGRLIFSAVTGGTFTAGAFTAGISANAIGQSDITIPNKDGRYEFENTTFTGSMSNYRMYGVDGVNAGFEFDGTVFVPINTPLDAVRKPSHLAVHQNQLFYSYQSSVLNSNLGNPYGWTTTGGTAESACGDRVVGLKVQAGQDGTPALAVFCRNLTKILYGATAADFQLIDFNHEQGAIEWTVQKIHQTLYFDDRGVTALAQAQEFGNFIESTLSRAVTPLLAAKRNLVTDSHVTRDKQQYRLFFRDGSGIYFMYANKRFSAMPVLFPDTVLCSVSAEVTGGGEEVAYFGSSDGFVRQMERGTSFDGRDINASLYLVFNNSKSYRSLKKYRHLTLEAKVSGLHQYAVGHDLSYLSEESAQPGTHNQDVSFDPPIWGEFIWDEFTWDGELSLVAKHIAIDGDGQNLAVKILSSGKSYSPLTITGAFLQYSQLRMLR